jgi:hypothetical protein
MKKKKGERMISEHTDIKMVSKVPALCESQSNIALERQGTEETTISCYDDNDDDVYLNTITRFKTNKINNADFSPNYIKYIHIHIYVCIYMYIYTYL